MLSLKYDNINMITSKQYKVNKFIGISTVIDRQASVPSSTLTGLHCLVTLQDMMTVYQLAAHYFSLRTSTQVRPVSVLEVISRPLL